MLGSSATLRWKTSNATNVSINGIGSVDTNGQQLVSPTTTTTFKHSASDASTTTFCTANVMVKKLKTTPGTFKEMTGSGNFTRNFVVHIPKIYDKNKSYPLLFPFHGASQSAYVALDRFDAEAKSDAEGIIVVAPNGYERQWNDGRGSVGAIEGSKPALAGVDDVAVVRQLLTIM